MDYLAEDSPVSLEASSSHDCPSDHTEAGDCASHSQAVELERLLRCRQCLGLARQPLRMRAVHCLCTDRDMHGSGKGHQGGCGGGRYMCGGDLQVPGPSL